jgi:hypothetical protein
MDGVVVIRSCSRVGVVNVRTISMSMVYIPLPSSPSGIDTSSSSLPLGHGSLDADGRPNERRNSRRREVFIITGIRYRIERTRPSAA